MVPKPKSLSVFCDIQEADFALVPDHLDEHLDENRKLRFNIRENIENLKNLDYSKVVWRNVLIFIALHLYSFYGIYLVFTSCMWETILFVYAIHIFAGLGITMGAHRLWSHKSFKAKLPLRVMLAIGQTMALQNSIYEWTRDHRLHHKQTETDADPHNAKRGFFFSHMGWLMYRKHPDIKKKGKTLDLSDLLEDPVVRFQKDNYKKLIIIFWGFVPLLVPFYFWNENIITCFMVSVCLRYTMTLHVTWLVNSLAHWVGNKPYDKNIQPVQNSMVSILTLGEGWHNFHHVFPFDYRASESGTLIHFNLATALIEMFARIGWTYDLKATSDQMIRDRALRTGDGSKKRV